MSTPVLKKVHTFADDLNLVRSERGITTKKSAPVAQKMPTPVTRDQVTVATASATGPKKIITNSSATLKPSANDLPATIITDQRSKRFNLTSEMSSAIGEWWNKKVQSVKKTKKKNLYGLPAAERRKGVVTAATTHTGRHVASDYHAVVERVKTKPEPEPTTVVERVMPPPTTTPSVEPASGWETANEAALNTVLSIQTTTETSGFVSQMEEPQTTGVVVTDITYRQPRIEPTIPEYPIEESKPEEEELLQPTIDETKSVIFTEFQEPAVTPITPTPRSFEKITPTLPTIATTTSTSPNAFTMMSEVPAPVLQNKPDYVKTTIAARKEALASTPTTTPSRLFTLAPYLAGGTFVFVTVGTIAYFMIAGTSSAPEVITGDTTLPINTFGNSGDQLPLTTTGGVVTATLDAPNKSSLYKAISETANQGEGLQIVTPLAHDSILPLGSREILSLLNRQFSPSFIGSVIQVKLGMYRNEPVIILSVSDGATARGSMFLWENSMSQDLSPWFGIPFTNNASGSSSQFKDSQIAGYDVRILKDDIGTERITYGIIGQSTILITTTSTAFLNITENYNLF
ncbi:MAG: hypothetical protein ACK4SL_04090 [Candidatus Paceibacteria bacterium]